MSVYFRPFDDLDSPNAGQRWNTYVQEFEAFCSFQGVTDDTRKGNGLLSNAGSAVFAIYNTLRPQTMVNKKDSSSQDVKDHEGKEIKILQPESFELISSRLRNHFNPAKSIAFEQIQFRKLVQRPDENTLSFVTRLRRIVVT